MHKILMSIVTLIYNRFKSIQLYKNRYKKNNKNSINLYNFLNINFVSILFLQEDEITDSADKYNSSTNLTCN